MMLAAVETHPDIPVVTHQDHGTAAAVCQQSIRSSFTMMDGSFMIDGKTPASYNYTVDIIRRCGRARCGGVGGTGSKLPGPTGNQGEHYPDKMRAEGDPICLGTGRYL